MFVRDNFQDTVCSAGKLVAGFCYSVYREYANSRGRYVV
ncbi:hypothetical protein SALWKB12_0049 [Snodgrassella communis]|nr:hypothetical protein SALWKB12_0049 [Snodgrassella communis]